MENGELFYIGGYSGKKPYSLYLCRWELNRAEVLESYEIENASYVCLSPDRRYLYAVIETGGYKGQMGGGVAAFAVQEDGRLRFINDGFTGGTSPCYLSVSRDGQMLYTANYGSGSTAFFAIRPDGGIGERKKLIPHTDFGPASHAAPGRQDGAHAHFITPVCVDGVQTLWICDLGLDCVIALDREGSELARFQTPPGYGPRHLALHPSLPFAYVVCEMGSAALAIEYGFSEGAVHLKASGAAVSALPEPDPTSSCAAVRVSPGSRHLLVSNRGARTDSISVLGLDAEGGLTGLEHTVSAGGSCPRDIRFDPAGKKLFAANQDSDTVCVFDWDEETGSLVPTDMRISIQRPTCVLFKTVTP